MQDSQANHIQLLISFNYSVRNTCVIYWGSFGYGKAGGKDKQEVSHINVARY